MKIQKLLSVSALVMLTLGGGVQLARADAHSDYEKNWAAKEKKATTPTERAKFATELMTAVDKEISGGKGGKPKGDSIAGQQSEIAALSGKRKDEVVLLCTKAYEFGSRQPDGYAPAARALGVLQTVDPEKRLDSLLKLKKMFEEVYAIAPSKNLGIAKGFAAVNQQVGEEQWSELQRDQADGKVKPEQYVAGLKSIVVTYSRGLEVIRAAEAAIRPYAKGKPAYQEFLALAEQVEKDLVDSQAEISSPLAAALELDRMLKSVAAFRTRLAGNPNDAAAADHLVRFYLNELDDPGEIEKVVVHASPAVKNIVSLLEKPVDKLTAAQALAVAQWCDKSNDNVSSPNRIAMCIRTRVYCEAYVKAAKTRDDDWKQIDATLKRLALDLSKAQLPEDKVSALTAAYVQALEPPEVVAVAPAPDPDPEVKPEPTPKAEPRPKPVSDPTPPAPNPTPAAHPATDRRLAKIKVETPPPPQRDSTSSEAKRDSNLTIFDFGRD